MPLADRPAVQRQLAARSPPIHVDGHSREIAPQADPVTRTRRVRITLNDPPETSGLEPPVTVRSAATRAQCSGATSAILAKDGKTFVWIVDPPPARFRWHGVETGSRRGGRPRHRGLAAGARIVTAEIHSLKEDKKSEMNRTRPHEVIQPFRLGPPRRSLVWYFMIAFMAAGLFSYLRLGREEDPAFTIKTMVIQAQWPGASAEEITRQVTDRIEKKLEELRVALDYTKSLTVAGQTTVFVYLRDNTNARDVAPTWARVWRNMIADIKTTFPQGVIGPAYNDRFGDVFGGVYAFTSDGLSQRQLHDQVEDIRAKILTVLNVGKVDILGARMKSFPWNFQPERSRHWASILARSSVRCRRRMPSRHRACSRSGRSASACGSTVSLPRRQT